MVYPTAKDREMRTHAYVPSGHGTIYLYHGCVLNVVFMGSELQGLLFICVTKQPEADSFKCSHSNCEYCLAALTVVSWYCVLEMWYLWYRCSK